MARLERFRWESELSKSFRENTVPELWSRHSGGTWVRMHESTCSEGRADIVWGRFENGRLPSEFKRHSDLLQNMTASRILASLRPGTGLFEGELFSRIGVTLPVLRRWLRALVNAELIEQTSDGAFRRIAKKRLPKVEICSFELKLKNWQRALYQATRYRSFSHRVFVVMPAEAAGVAYRHRDLFSKANVGLVSHEISGVSRVLVRPKKRPPYATHRTIMAIGMLSASKIKWKRHSGTRQSPQTIGRDG
jgi:hypothetical protein